MHYKKELKPRKKLRLNNVLASDVPTKQLTRGVDIQPVTTAASHHGKDFQAISL